MLWFSRWVESNSFVTPWTICSLLVPLSRGFSRQEYRSDGSKAGNTDGHFSRGSLTQGSNSGVLHCSLSHREASEFIMKILNQLIHSSLKKITNLFLKYINKGSGLEELPHTQEKEMQKAKWLPEEALQINSCEKKRSEKQRRKGKICPFECRVPKNNKEIRKSSSVISAKK